jgi:hypothetical protein
VHAAGQLARAHDNLRWVSIKHVCECAVYMANKERDSTMHISSGCAETRVLPMLSATVVVADAGVDDWRKQ